MTIPQWARDHMQNKINEGNMDYNSLGESARSVLTPMSEKAKQAQVQQAESANLQNNANFKQFEASQPGPTVSKFNQFVAQENPTFVAEHPTLSKVLAAPGYALQKAADLFPQGLQNWANRAGQSGGEVMTMVDNPNRATTGNWLGDTSADLAGGLMGFVGNPSPGGVESLGAKIWQGGEQAIGKVLPKLLPNAPKLAQDALKITGATIPFEATRAIANNRKMDPAEMGTAAGANVLLAGLTHGLGRLGAKGEVPADFVPERPTEWVTDAPAEQPTVLKQMQGKYQGLKMPRIQADKLLPDNPLLKQMQSTYKGIYNGEVTPLPRPKSMNRNVDVATLPDKYPLPDTSNLEGKALVNRAKQQQPALPGNSPLALPEPFKPNWDYGTGKVDPQYQLGQLSKLQKETVNRLQGSEISLKREPQPPEVELLNKVMEKRIGPIRLSGKVQYAPEAMQNPEMKIANLMAESNTGRGVIPVKNLDAAGASLGDKIYVNANTKQPILYVANHEIIHTLETTAPDVHARLAQIIKEHIADQEGITKHYNDLGYAANKHSAELTADTMAEKMLEPAFWSRVRQQSPEILKPILEAIDRIVANFRGKVGNDMTVLPYLRDIETMRTRLADEYNGYLADVKAGKVQGQDVAAKMEGEPIQKINSANTSLSQVAGTFKSKSFEPGNTNLDIGGGKYDKGTDFLAGKGVNNLVYDPFNRDATHNGSILEKLRSGQKHDSVTINNVLNVIAEPDIRANVIKQAAKSVGEGKKSYFQIYEGNGKGIGQQTSKGWQNNTKTEAYMKEVGQFFGKTERKGNLIIASEPKSNLGKATWGIDGNPSNSINFKQETPEDAKALILAGAEKIGKGIKYNEWAKQMVTEHGTGVEKNLAYIWHGAQDLLSQGKTTLKMGGQEIPVTMQQPDAQNASGLGKGAVTPGQVAQTNQYVDTSPIDINMGKNDKTTSTDIRQGYVGKLNKQIVTGNQLRDTIQKLAPKEQMGIQLFIDAGGDINRLQEMAQNMDNVDANGVDAIMDSFIPNTKITYREAYKQSLNLSPEAQKAAQLAQQYYKEAGQYSLDMGSTKGVLEDYANRAWKQPPSGTVKTEVNKPGLNPYTSHSKERFYGTIGEGILNGKEPATLNAGDLLSIHNQEMARANTNRALADSLKTNGLGAFQFEKPPQGFTAIDSMGKDIPTMHDGKPAIIHQNFVIPDGIAKGLRAITEPNYMTKIDAVRHLQAYQGLVKTVDLSFSLFHHITLAAQALYNSHGGVDFIKNWDKMSKLGSESFNASEQWGAQHGVMTTKFDDNMDVIRQLAGKESLINKGWNSNNLAIKAISAIPKGLAEVANVNTEFLFGKIQRWLKVMDWQIKATAFVGKNPNMQNPEVTKGLRQIASEVNDAYGGLNWKAIGVTPTVQAIARLGFLAPDWTFSSARMLGKAFTKGPGGNAARSQFAVGIIGGAILTEGLNNLLTGHYTDKNPKGHELEVEVQPGVYISLFRSGIGDVTKWSANMLNQGVLGGTVNTIQGKASPLVRTAVGQLANKQFTGAPITSTKNTPLENDWARLKELGNSFAPVPFGVSGTSRYLKGGEATPLGTGLVSTGAGRYSASKPLSSLADPASAYAGNWLSDLTSPSSSASDALITKINTQNKTQIDNTKKVEQELGKALTTGSPTTDVFNRNNVPTNKRSELLKSAKDTMATGKLSPLAQKFQGLSKDGQQQLLKTLTPAERVTLGNVKLKTK